MSDLPKQSEVLHRTMEAGVLRLAPPEGSTEELIDLSMSSDEPVEMRFGTEVLEHSVDAVDLARFQRVGLPLNVMDFLPSEPSHGGARHVGIVTEPRIENGKLYGRARFSRASSARDTRQDVLDGIRTTTSLGYRVKKYQLSKGPGGERVLRAVRWEPMEVTLVPVPADFTVGVGRSGDESALPVEVVALASAPTEAAPKERSMDDKSATPDPGAKVTTLELGVEARVAEIVRLAKEHDCMDRVPGWMDSRADLAAVQKDIMAVLTERTKATLTKSGGDIVDMSDREKARYNLPRAILAQARGDWRDAGLEREVSEALEKKLDSSITRHGGFFVPTTLPVSTRAQPPLVAGTASVGGNIVFTQAGSLIELLRNQMVIDAAGAQFLSGLTGGPLSFPRQITAATASWTGEATSVAGSYLTLDRLTLSPKNLTGWTSYSRSLLAQSTPDVDAMVRADLAKIHAVAIDRAGLRGAGTLEPTGIISTSSIGSVTVGTNGGAATYAHIIGLEEAVDVGNALAGSLVYVTTPQVKADLKQTVVLTNTIAGAVWGMDNNVNGYRALATNQVPSNLTKGTSTTVCHAIVFGNFRELIIGEWGAFELLSDPITLADSGQIKLVTYQMIDVGVRHPAAFAACLDVTS